VLARGRDFGEVFELFRPGIDRAAEARRLRVDGRSDLLSLDDLYPDALPTLRELAARGYRLALAANQPAPAADVLARMDAPFELVATSAAWGVAKPDPRFFQRILDELELPATAVAYVGDRVDNDIIPASEAGMVAIFVRRGPWAWVAQPRGVPDGAAAAIDRLTELPGILESL
jgi:FMN phosphatase YigB (HAD superfamily)